MAYINFFSTLLVIVLIIFAHRQSNSKITLSNKIYWCVFCLAFILGFALRAYKFGEIPGGLNQDEAMAAVEAKALLIHGTDRFGMKFPVYFTAWIFAQMNVLLSYIMGPFIKFFGFNIFVVRLPNFLFSIAGMLFLFFLIKDMFGKIPALITFCFCAINPWHIMQSRWALEANLLPHFFIIALYFLFRGLAKSKKFFIYISMFFFAMCMYCYGIAFYTVNLFLFTSAIYLLHKKILPLKEIIICLLIYIFFSWPIYAVMFINAFDLPTIETPWFTIPYFPEQNRQSDILFFSENFVWQLKTNLVSLTKFLFQICPANSSAINGFGSIYVCSVPILFLGIITSLKKLFSNEKNLATVGYFFVLANFFIGLFAIVSTSNCDLVLNRANFIFYSMIILVSLGAHNLIESWRKNICVLFASYYIMTVAFCATYFGEYKNYIAEVFYSDFIKILDDTKENTYDQIFITSNTQDRNTDFVSEILTLFCHDIDAEYFQGKTKVVGKTYSEKYIYKDFLSEEAIPKKNTAYIIRDVELHKQYLKKFKVTRYNSYYLLESK